MFSNPQRTVEGRVKRRRETGSLNNNKGQRCATAVYARNYSAAVILARLNSVELRRKYPGTPMPWWNGMFMFAFRIYTCLHLFIYSFFIYMYIYLHAVCYSHFVVLSITVMFPMLYVSFEISSALTCLWTLQLLIFCKFTETLWYNIRDTACHLRWCTDSIHDSRGNAVFAREMPVTRLDLSTLRGLERMLTPLTRHRRYRNLTVKISNLVRVLKLR